MSVLDAQLQDFWEENGYVVVPQAVSTDLLPPVIDSIERFLGKDLSDPSTWYDEPMYPGGIINMNRDQSMWDTRQDPRLHGAFSDIFGTEKLRVSVDRTNMNPPATETWNHKGMIHWDMDSSARPVTYGVQGVLCLSDTDADQGGFQCVPGFHKQLESWAETQPADRPAMHPDTTGLQIKHVAAGAGDLIIWHRALPHGNSRNHTDRPRLCQYITMGLAPDEHEPAPMPLARTHRTVLAEVLGTPEGLVERWLRLQHEADRVVVKADRVSVYEPVPSLVRVEWGDQVEYLHERWATIIDEQTIEGPRQHADRVGLPIAGAADGSEAEIRRHRAEVPAARNGSRLRDSDRQKLSARMLEDPPGEAPHWTDESVADVVSQEFGIDIDTCEADLTPLGRKLTGVDAW